MKNISVKIIYKTGRYVAVNENIQIVLSCSIEQAVHDFINRFLHVMISRFMASRYYCTIFAI